MNVRLTVLLVIVLSLVIGGVFISRALSTKEPPKQEPQLFKVKETDITSVSISYNDQRIDYVKRQNGWTITLPGENMPVSQRWSGSTLVLSGPRCTRAVSENIEDPSLYGLDNPTMAVELTVAGGSRIEFHLGDQTPDTQDPKWYARLAGSPRLCTLPDIYGTVVKRLVTDPPYDEERLLFRVGEDDMFSISIEHGDNEVAFGRKENRWVGQAQDGIEKHTSSEWAGMPQILGGPFCIQPAMEEETDMTKYGFGTPVANVLIFTLKGEFKEYELGELINGDTQRQYARIIQSNRFCEVAIQTRQLIIDLVNNPPFQETPQE